MSTNESSLSSREQQLVELVAHMMLDDGEALKGTLDTARSAGLADEDIEGARELVRKVESSRTENDTSLSELLSKTTESSCCS